ncbi:MAG: V-type ATPase subunit [Promethearchaeota archaeon]
MLIKATIDYSFINAKIRGLKSKLLTVGDYERLLGAQSLSEISRLLGTTVYADLDLGEALRADPVDLNEIDRVLNTYYFQFTEYMVNLLPKYARNFAELAHRRKAYYTGLKTIIRGIDLHIDKKEITRYLIPPSTEDYEIFNDLLKSETVAEVIDRLPDSQLQKLLRRYLSDYEKLKDTLVLEQALTREYYETLFRESKKLRRMDIKSVFRLVNAEMDLLNLSMIIRGKNLNIEEATLESWIVPIKSKLGNMGRFLKARPKEIYNLLTNTPYRELAPAFQTAFETDSPHFEVIDKAINQFLIHRAYVSFREVPFHLGVFFSFLLLRSMEIYNLRAILVGKHDEIDSQLVRRFLTIL